MALTFTLHEFTIFQSDIHETQRLKINFYESNLKKYFNFRAENHQQSTLSKGIFGAKIQIFENFRTVLVISKLCVMHIRLFSSRKKNFSHKYCGMIKSFTSCRRVQNGAIATFRFPGIDPE